MKNKLIVSILAATLVWGATAAPALADNAASTRNIFIVGAAAAVGIINYNHNKHLRDKELEEQGRRQASYRSYFYHKFGYYPSEQQFRDWYFKTYGVYPS
ncbi:MAG TPA: hypothetical protein VGZ00_05685 [Candidatus Baltobacteraceae bacterium]|nr:hypothetical protein [Candidatus Baltobacteraceae bacterium]